MVSSLTSKRKGIIVTRPLGVAITVVLPSALI